MHRTDAITVFQTRIPVCGAPSLLLLTASTTPLNQPFLHRLTVAMMSRITLHLKKQGRLHEIIDWDSGGVYTFSGIANSIHHTTSRLHFNAGRSHRSEGRGGNSQGSHNGPTQVTVTIDELVTRDFNTGFLDVSDDTDAETRAPSMKDPAETKKHVEWLEMSAVDRERLHAKDDPPV